MRVAHCVNVGVLEEGGDVTYFTSVVQTSWMFLY